MTRFSSSQLTALKALGIAQVYERTTTASIDATAESTVAAAVKPPKTAHAERPVTSLVSGASSLGRASALTSAMPTPMAQPTSPGRLAKALSAQPSATVETEATNTHMTTQAMTARLEAIQTADFQQLASMVSECRACGLCKERKQAVLGTGDLQARWMIVGEAPGADEDEQGLPFVGRSGKLLDSILASAGLARGQGVYIANVIKCRPPANRNPELDEVQACEPFLQRQLALIRPKIILAMGRFAVTSLLQSKDAIGSLRQKQHHYQGIPVVVTYHPAYLLRNLGEKAKAWRDICFAQDIAAKSKD